MIVVMSCTGKSGLNGNKHQREQVHESMHEQE